MKLKFSFPSAVLLLAGSWLLVQPLPAQIDFSVLDKWRGWRPPRENPQRDPAELRNHQERPAERVEGPRPLDPAEERAREKRRTEKTRHLQSNWLPLLAPAGVEVRTTMAPIAHGSSTLNSKVSDPVGMLSPLGKVAMSGTPIATEALRRSVAILALIKKIPADDPDPRHSSWGDAEAAFLAGQAALAMEGAPLEVVVEPDNFQRASASAEAIRPALTDLGEQQARLEHAAHERTAAYGELTAVQAGSSEEIAQKRERVMARFKQASDEKRQAGKQAAQDEIIILETSSSKGR